MAHAVFFLCGEASTNILTVWGKILSRKTWAAVRWEVFWSGTGSVSR